MSTIETSETSSVASAEATPTGLPIVTKPGRVPIKSWAGELDPRTLEQATNVSNLPFAIDHVALMPDGHAGYGMPIGGVLFADKVVVPYAIGVDIGCGVALVETDLTVDDLPPADLDKVLASIDRGVPTGHFGLKTPVDREIALAEMGVAKPESVKDAWFDRARSQLGTLGGGNHFLELQRDEGGTVFVMLHSGSRNLGKTICDEFHKRALAQNRAWHAELPHDELAYLPVGTDDFVGYWSAMEFALRFAEVNRSRMLDVVERSFEHLTKIGRFDRLVDVHHNYAAWENHAGQNGIVHRKGAVRARAGEIVLIPGSMGSASYVGEGLGNAESFETCQHGAGRALSRTAARKAKTSKEVYDEMSTLGVVLRSSDPKGVAEEAAFAYKNIESVMAASASLVKPTKRLTPLGVVKG
ncbi:MAG TPA: RtcB family protein [Candidatus Limnocylindrales bacterium]|jgi:tRNA-splicing ligase RtcB|nr:RtcB family protein [Candidatus Limnocylindrales bacterium]